MIEPYYQIDFNAVACKFEASINDVNLLSYTVEGQVGTLLPLNSGILKSGPQQLKIKVLPIEGQPQLHPEAAFSYTIKIFEVRYGFELKEELEGYTFPAPDPSKKQTELEHIQEFHAEVPFTIDSWQQGILLTDVDDLSDRLKRAYGRIAMQIRTKDYTGLKKELANREKTMATSMYLSKEDADARINALITDIESGYVIMPLDPASYISISGNGRLAAYKKLSGEPLFTLMKPETGEELMLDLCFYIPAGKTEFEVI